MNATARSKASLATAVLVALVVAACLLIAPAHARAAGFSLGEAFGSMLEGISQGADQEAPEPEPAEPEVDPGFVVGFGPSLPPGAEAPAPAPAEDPVADPEPSPAPGPVEPEPEPVEPDPAAENPEPAEPAVDPEPAPEPAGAQAARPSLPAVYEELTGEAIPDIPDDPVTQAALSAVGYEAAGVLVWIPEGYDVVALDELFVVAMEGDFYLDVTQIYSDFESMGGTEHLADFLAELAAEDPTVEIFPVDENGRAVPYVNMFGTELYSFRSVDELDGTQYFSLYIPTLDGRLANMWVSVPAEDADYYGEVVEFMVEMAMLVEPGGDPVDAEALAAGGEPAATEVVQGAGVEFSAYGMEYDPEVEGWVRSDDQFLYVGAFADYLYGLEDLTEDDLYWAATDLIEQSGFVVAEAYLETEGAEVYVYVGVSDDGFIEVYGFVPMDDGTVTLVAGLVEFGDARSAETLAAVFQSIAYADPVGDAAADLIAGGAAALGADDAEGGPILDPEYLARNATLV